MENGKGEDNGTLVKLFGIISPIFKQKHSTVEELRRISLSVHLWADIIHGNVNFLHSNHLTERHFKEILEFAGPSSAWKLLQERSISQYINIWRNSMTGKQKYQGHPETGYETKMQVHDPSQPFCPFDHCNLSASYMHLSPYKQKQTPDLCAEVLSRKLFTSDQSVNVLNEPRNTSPQVKQSPSKEELKLENKALHQKLKVLETKRGVGNSSCNEMFEKKVTEVLKPLIQCNKPD